MVEGRLPTSGTMAPRGRDTKYESTEVPVPKSVETQCTDEEGGCHVRQFGLASWISRTCRMERLPLEIDMGQEILAGQQRRTCVEKAWKAGATSIGA